MGYSKWNIYVYQNYIYLWLWDNQDCLICISDISVDPISTVRSHFIIQKNVIIQLEAHLTETP